MSEGKDNFNKWFDNLKLVAAIIVGTLYVQSRISETIVESIEPLKIRIEKLEIIVPEIKQKTIINEQKIEDLRELAKEYLKPKEISIKEK